MSGKTRRIRVKIRVQTYTFNELSIGVKDKCVIDYIEWLIETFKDKNVKFLLK